MAKITKGSALYMVDPADGSVNKINKVTGMDPGAAVANALMVRTWDSKFAEPIRTDFEIGDGTITIDADPADPIHVRLYELSTGNESEAPVIQFALGWSDGTAPPTATEGVFTLPATRTWYTFAGWVSSFPLDFTGDKVETSATVKRTSMGAWTVKGDAA